MNNAVDPTRSWPPECCVPAFLHAAMSVMGFTVPFPEALPGILGVRVRPDQENPLGLALANDRYPPGIRAVDAEREINRLFAELQLPLCFHRIPFLHVEFGLWEDVLDAAFKRDVVVGLGVDFSILMRRTAARSSQHVLRVLSRKGNHLYVVDDSGETTPSHFKVTNDRASEAVLAIPDGFWMIGDKKKLRLPFTLPWETSH